MLRRAGACFRTGFKDRDYANPEVALSAAQAFRDALLERLLSAHTLNKISSGNIPGITRRKKRGRLYWQLRMVLDGKGRFKFFAIDRYGEEEAFRLAVETRNSWLKMAEIDKPPEVLPADEEIARIELAIRQRFGESPAARNARSHPYNDDPMYGIVRQEADAATGKGGRWVMTIARRGNRHVKHFADAAYGGETPALTAARHHRDELLGKIRPMLKREYQQKAKSHSTSGVAGVWLARKDGQPWHWQAEISMQGKKQAKRFSVQKYGFDQAFELARNARETMLNQVTGYYVFSPAAKKLYAADA